MLVLRGWLFVMPALVAYAVFVLWPIVQTFRYSFYNWDGVDPAAVGRRPELQDSVQQRAADRGDRPCLRADLVLQWRPGRARPGRRHRHAPVRDGPDERRGQDGAVPTAGGPARCRRDRLELDAVDYRRCRPSAHRCRSRQFGASLAGGLQHRSPRRRGHRRLGAAGLVHGPAVCRHDQDRPGAVRVGPVGRRRSAPRVRGHYLTRACAKRSPSA